LIEAAIIVNLLKRKGLWEKVKVKASELQEFDGIDRFTWFRMKIMCPVLDTDTNLCMAYENRPIECALHYVTTDVKSCDPWGTSVVSYKKVDNDALFHELATRLTSVIGDSIWVFEAPIYKALLLSEVFKSKEIADQDTLIQTISKERI
jgi:Fe-S-cluster containining protein